MEKIAQNNGAHLPVTLLIASCFFAVIAAPTITALDAGELGAASWELGIAHPPGFPVFLQTQKIFMSLIPVGDMGLRGNFGAGIFASLTLGMLGLLARSMRVGWAQSFIGITAVALSPCFLLHSTTIEVYSGLGLWLSIMIWLSMRFDATADPRFILLMAFVMGLGIGGHHPETRLFSLVFAGRICMRIYTRPKLIAGCVASGCIGLSVLAYLPLRARAEPWRNWGDPSHFDGFWAHFWGARIRAAYGDEMGVINPQVVESFTDQLLSGAPVLCMLGILGLLLMRKDKIAGLLVVLAGTDLAYCILINPMGVRDLQNGIPLICIFGLGTMVGLQRLTTKMPRYWAGAVGLIAFFTIGFSADWDEIVNGRNSRIASRLLNASTDVLPPESLALTASDTLSAAFAYGQVVEGHRPDVAAVVRQHIRFGSSIDPVVRRCPMALTGWTAGANLHALDMLRTGWPLGWEWSSGLDGDTRPKGLKAGFPLLVSHPTATTSDPFDLKSGLTRTDAKVLAGLASDQGQVRLAGIIPGSALPYLEYAVRTRPNDHHHWTNLGVALGASNRYKEALDVTANAVKMAPFDSMARINLARYALQLNRYEYAIDALEPLIGGDGVHASALGLRGVARGNLGDLNGARSDFEAALRVDKNQFEARTGLKRLKMLSNEKSQVE